MVKTIINWFKHLFRPNYERYSEAKLVKALRDPKTKGRRGSIVYWLWQHYPCEDLADDMVECVISGSYEEVEHATSILEKKPILMSVKQASILLNKLNAVLNKEVGWRADYIGHCMNIVDSWLDEGE